MRGAEPSDDRFAIPRVAIGRLAHFIAPWVPQSHFFVLGSCGERCAIRFPRQALDRFFLVVQSYHKPHEVNTTSGHRFMIKYLKALVECECPTVSNCFQKLLTRGNRLPGGKQHFQSSSDEDGSTDTLNLSLFLTSHSQGCSTV